MNSTDIVTIVQQNIDPGGPGILAINKLLLPPPLPRTNNVVRRTDSKQLRAGAGGRRQYSTAIQVPPPLPSSPSLLTHLRPCSKKWRCRIISRCFHLPICKLV